ARIMVGCVLLCFPRLNLYVFFCVFLRRELRGFCGQILVSFYVFCGVNSSGMPRLPLRVFPLGLAIGVMVTACVRMDRVAARSTQPARPAPSIGAEILKGLSWRSIGPLRGGRSLTISGVKGHPKDGYFGATGGGLWKTIDGGESWTPVTDGQI